MPSFIWLRDPQEAMDNPYEYPAQEQFSKEAKTILDRISKELSEYDMKFTLEDRSLKKAIWLLHNDALSSLQDCLFSIDSKHHRIAGLLLRNISETLDLAAYLNSNTAESKTNLIKWYDDEIVPHSTYRNYIKETIGEQRQKEKAFYYQQLSKFTHRTYKILLYSYVLGFNNYLAYDDFRDNEILVLPGTISMYYAILSEMIFHFSLEVAILGLVKIENIGSIWEESLDKETVERIFIPLTRKQVEARRAYRGR